MQTLGASFLAYYSTFCFISFKEMNKENSRTIIQCRQGPDDSFTVACFDTFNNKVTSKIEKTPQIKLSQWIKSKKFETWIKSRECDPSGCRKPKAMVCDISFNSPTKQLRSIRIR